LVSGAQIVVPAGVSQNTVNIAMTMVVSTAAASGAVNPNANLTESKGVQNAQSTEANIVSGAAGQLLPPVNSNNNPGTGV
jgi:hypothetical protein